MASAIRWGTNIMRVHVMEDWGEHGACTTDVGPEHVTANTGTMPFAISLRTAMGLDFTVNDPRLASILPWWCALMVQNAQGLVVQ